MKHLDRICLILLTLGVIYLSWSLHTSMIRIIEGHEANIKAYGIMAVKALDERNLAEAHVAYLQKEITRFHRSGWKK